MLSWSMMKRKLLLIPMLVILLLPAIGCAMSHELTELTEKAIMATSEAHSYRINLVSTPVSDENTVNISFKLDFAAPDRYHERSDCFICGDDNWYEFILIGDQRYFRGSVNPEWCKLPCEDNAALSGYLLQITHLDHLAEILEPLDWLVDLQMLPDETVNGFDCWHYVGTVDMKSYMKQKAGIEEGQVPSEVYALHEAMRRGTRVVELWVEKDNYLIQQLKIREFYTTVNVDSGEVDSFSGVTTTQFHDYNEPIIIEPPLLQ